MHRHVGMQSQGIESPLPILTLGTTGLSIQRLDSMASDLSVTSWKALKHNGADLR